YAHRGAKPGSREFGTANSMAVLQLYRVYLRDHIYLIEHELLGFCPEPPFLSPSPEGRGRMNYLLAEALPKTLPLREESMRLKATAHDGFGIQTQPLLQQRGIGATEVVVVVQVAFEQLLRRQGGIFPVQPALDRIADDKG